VNLPVLMRVQPGDKTVISRLDDGTERRSDAHTVVATADAVTVQGVDDGEPWALWIDRTTGRFTLTAAGPEEAFSAFGICSTELLK
jgi:hypothetical protein